MEPNLKEPTHQIDQPDSPEIAPNTQVSEPTEPVVNEPTSKEESKSKKSLIIAICFAVVCAIVAIVFACLYFMNPTTNQPATNQDNGNQSNGSQSNAGSNSESNNNEPTDEEVEITDTYIIRDLDKKVAALFRVNDTSISRSSRIGGYYDYLELFSNGTLNEAAKVASVIDTLSDQFRYISSEERNSAWDIIGYQGSDDQAEFYKKSIAKAINGNIVAAAYKDMYGTELSKQSYDGCYYYLYDANYDFYFQQPFGCGGTSPYDGHYYKYDYTMDNEHAYVYMAVGAYNAEDRNVYCDIIDKSSEDYQYSVCVEDTDYNFVLDSSNYQNFAKYRFVFNKADNGTYYFSKVEKL